LCLFLADRPLRLGHLEISFGICSKVRDWLYAQTRTLLSNGFFLSSAFALFAQLRQPEDAAPQIEHVLPIDLLAEVFCDRALAASPTLTHLDDADTT
jgi:hypothetical protein